MSNVIPTEKHPLEPFLPEGARILMLGSFPPKHERWSMEFFYPNWINDMWRIFGHIFFDDRNHFVVPGCKRFDRDKCAAFAGDKGVAMFDTASEVRRLKDNASDKFLEIVRYAVLTTSDESQCLGSSNICKKRSRAGTDDDVIGFPGRFDDACGVIVEKIRYEYLLYIFDIHFLLFQQHLLILVLKNYIL